MKKTHIWVLFFVMGGVLSWFCPSIISAGEMELRTYNPSARGIYQKIQLVPAALPATCNNGEIVANQATGRIAICEQSQWRKDDVDVWDFSGTNVFPSSSRFSGGYNVGIGRTGAQAALDVYSINKPLAMFGSGLSSSGIGSFSVGLNHSISGSYSVAVGGLYNSITGSYSNTFGTYNGIASGYFSNIFGGYYSNQAINDYTNIFGGYYSVASGWFSSVLAGYYDNIASGQTSSIINGNISNRAIGAYSNILGGSYNSTSGFYSTTLGGYGLNAQSYQSVAIGRYNVDNGTTWSWVDTDPLLVVGNGVAGAPSNAFEVSKEGSIKVGNSPSREAISVFRNDGRRSGLSLMGHTSNPNDFDALLALSDSQNPNANWILGKPRSIDGALFQYWSNVGASRNIWSANPSGFMTIGGVKGGTQWSDNHQLFVVNQQNHGTGGAFLMGEGSGVNTYANLTLGQEKFFESTGQYNYWTIAHISDDFDTGGLSEWNSFKNSLHFQHMSWNGSTAVNANALTLKGDGRRVGISQQIPVASLHISPGPGANWGSAAVASYFLDRNCDTVTAGRCAATKIPSSLLVSHFTDGIGLAEQQMTGDRTDGIIMWGSGDAVTSGVNKDRLRFEFVKYMAEGGYTTKDKTVMLMTPEGKVAINKDDPNYDPNYTLEVFGMGAGNITAVFEGNVWANGWMSPSDERLKTNIVPIPDSLDKITQIKGVYYNWIDPAKDQSRQVGVIAQDVEKVLPEIVATDDKGSKSLDYSKLVPVLIESVKELKAEVDSLKKQIEELKK